MTFTVGQLIANITMLIFIIMAATIVFGLMNAGSVLSGIIFAGLVISTGLAIYSEYK